MPEFPNSGDSQLNGQWAPTKSNMTTVPRATATSAVGNSQVGDNFIFNTKQDLELYTRLDNFNWQQSKL